MAYILEIFIVLLYYDCGSPIQDETTPHTEIMTINQ